MTRKIRNSTFEIRTKLEIRKPTQFQCPFNLELPILGGWMSELEVFSLAIVWLGYRPSSIAYSADASRITYHQHQSFPRSLIQL